MRLKKGEWLLLIVNLLVLIGFSIYYVGRQNYEFLIYIGVIVLLLSFVVYKDFYTTHARILIWFFVAYFFFFLFLSFKCYGNEEYSAFFPYTGIAAPAFKKKNKLAYHIYFISNVVIFPILILLSLVSTNYLQLDPDIVRNAVTVFSFFIVLVILTCLKLFFLKK